MMMNSQHSLNNGVLSSRQMFHVKKCCLIIPGHTSNPGGTSQHPYQMRNPFITFCVLYLTFLAISTTVLVNKVTLVLIFVTGSHISSSSVTLVALTQLLQPGLLCYRYFFPCFVPSLQCERKKRNGIYIYAFFHIYILLYLQHL